MTTRSKVWNKNTKNNIITSIYERNEKPTNKNGGEGRERGKESKR